MRVGMGYDVHKLLRAEIDFGGVKVPHTLGLLGHSDADVLVHAIMDALLGQRHLAISESISRIQIRHIRGFLV